jgi:hypothetical protein
VETLCCCLACAYDYGNLFKKEADPLGSTAIHVHYVYTPILSGLAEEEQERKETDVYQSSSNLFFFFLLSFLFHLLLSPFTVRPLCSEGNGHTFECVATIGPLLV